MKDLITIEKFNKLTGRETLHPLVGVADLSRGCPGCGIQSRCNFYALLCGVDSLQLLSPGESVCFPSEEDSLDETMRGVFFHPDLLCDTPLERDIASYSCRCHCHRTLAARERKAISSCIDQISHELEHSIDRYSSTIIASQIGLLLNYCTRICSSQQSDNSTNKQI